MLFILKKQKVSYKYDLNKKLIPFVKFHKIESIKKSILNELFPIFIEQLKKYEFIKINRLDEKVLEFLNGKNEDGRNIL